jgi:hypothetical protein
MLKKSLILGLLAAIAIAPAAFAGEQTQGDSGTTNIDATNVGRGNKIRIINKTYVIKSQRRARKLLCQSPQSSSNQTQGNATNTAIAATNVGNRNRIKINNVTNVVQGQVDCSKN